MTLTEIESFLARLETATKAFFSHIKPADIEKVAAEIATVATVAGAALPGAQPVTETIAAAASEVAAAAKAFEPPPPPAQ